MRTTLILATALLVTVPVRAAEVHPLLPDDATTVAYVNVRQMVDLPPAKPHAEAMLGLVLTIGPELEQSLQALGIKPLDDIDTLLAGARALGSDDRTLIITGRFDRDKIQASVEMLARKEPKRITTIKVGDAVVYEDKVGRDTVYSTLVNPKTLVFSLSKDLVATAAKGGARKPKLSPEMAELIDKADDKKSVWAVFQKPEELLAYLVKEATSGGGPLTLPLPGTGGGLSKLSRVIESATIAVGIDKDVTVDVLLRTGDKDNGILVGDLLKVQKPVFKLLLPRNKTLGRDRGEALAEVFADAKIDADKGDVTVAFKFANEQLRRIMTAPKKP